MKCGSAERFVKVADLQAFRGDVFIMDKKDFKEKMRDGMDKFLESSKKFWVPQAVPYRILAIRASFG